MLVHPKLEHAQFRSKGNLVSVRAKKIFLVGVPLVGIADACFLETCRSEKNRAPLNTDARTIQVNGLCILTRIALVCVLQDTLRQESERHSLFKERLAKNSNEFK